MDGDVAGDRVTKAVVIRRPGGLRERWEWEEPRETEFAGHEWLRAAVTCGDRRREALVTEKIAVTPRLQGEVLAHMARWGEDVYHLPAVMAYVWGDIGFSDGSMREGLTMLIMDLEGIVRGIHPVEAEE